MALVASTRRFSFRSVHSLNTGVHREKLHGHEYFLEVSYSDCEMSEVENVVRERILLSLNGRDISESHGPATGETLVEWIHSKLVESPLGERVLGVALQETRKNRFVSARSKEYFL